jgi:ribosomal protein S18 acetylase RimI-like enzyme
MNMQYEIRKLGISDTSLAQELFILFRKVFDDEDVQVPDLPDEDYIKGLLSKDGFHVFVALAEDKVVGGLTAYELDMYVKKEKEAYLYDLAVDKRHRRQGVARSLITALQEYAKENNIHTIFVEAHAEDVEAIDFYTSIHAEMEDVKHFNINL